MKFNKICGILIAGYMVANPYVSTQNLSTTVMAKTKTLTVNSIVKAFKSAKLPIKNLKIYNAKNDDNKLLGRPNQYIGKFNWDDSRTNDKDLACTVEIFKNTSDLKARKKYIDGVVKNSGIPSLVHYAYVNKNAYLRISGSLTPAQSKQYEKVFKKL
jgi:hypothetical protein